MIKKVILFGLALVAISTFLFVGVVHAVDDISLADGTVGFSEIDLKLPGKNGHDLILSRSYNSRFYTSNPTTNVLGTTKWGGWIGHGWTSGLGMRAYVISASDPAQNLIAIESNGFREIFTYNTSTNKFTCLTPTNFSRVTFSTGFKAPAKTGISTSEVYEQVSEVQLTREDGTKFIFDAPCFLEYQGSVSSPVLSIGAFYLTQIVDTYGNKISISYEKLSPAFENVGPGKFLDLGKAAYQWVAGQSCPTKWAQAYYLKPSAITDSFGRTVSILANATGMITGYRYTNVNGTTNEIKYGYDSNGNLISVQVGDLPKQTYDYRYYKPNFYRYTETGVYESGFSWFKYYYFYERNESSYPTMSSKT